MKVLDNAIKSKTLTSLILLDLVKSVSHFQYHRLQGGFNIDLTHILNSVIGSVFVVLLFYSLFCCIMLHLFDDSAISRNALAGIVTV